MFGIGPQELILVLAVALIVVGPKRLPEMARLLGRGLNELRKVQDEVRDMVKFDLGADLDEPYITPPSHRGRSSAVSDDGVEPSSNGHDTSGGSDGSVAAEDEEVASPPAADDGPPIAATE